MGPAVEFVRAARELEEKVMKKNVFVAVLYFAVVAALLVPLNVWGVPSTSGNVTLTGTVSCAKCQGIQPLHKGYTRYTWALQSVNDGDDVVFVVGNDIYKLQGDKDQLLKHMEDKVTVTGTLEGHTLVMQTIGSASKTH
jgi:hypothetical protein